MFDVIFYTPDFELLWDDFVKERQLFFQFERKYMDYPGRNITDMSLLVKKQTDVVALFPACLWSKNQIFSHFGLSYGGILTNYPIEEWQSIWTLIEKKYKDSGFDRLFVRPLPAIYDKGMGDFFWQSSGQVVTSKEMVWIEVAADFKIKDLRKRGIKKAQKNGLTYGQESDIEKYWQALQADLWYRHRAKPVHDLNQISYLLEKFPDHISLWSCRSYGNILAGVVIYTHGSIAHAQYIFGSCEGRKKGATDGLIDFLVNALRVFGVKKISLGTSTKPDTSEPNLGLLSWKKGWSNQSCFVNTYQLEF